MAIDLLTLEPQQISKNLKGKYILLYGNPKCGKTSLAAEFKNVLIAGLNKQLPYTVMYIEKVSEFGSENCEIIMSKEV